MSAKPNSDRLPFEPAKKTSKKQPSTTQQKATSKRASDRKAGKKASESGKTKSGSGAAGSIDRSIPEVVNKRMVRRIAFFCGVPTLLGISTFVLSYFIISRGWFALPHTAVLLVSLGWFGLGVMGVSYGALSASWEEEESGSLLGIAEFKTNLGRTLAAWRAAKQQRDG